MTGIRVNRGRGHSYTIDGYPVMGVTTILGDGVPKKALNSWYAKKAAEYAVDNWAELDGKGAVAKFNEIKGAPWKDLGKASVKGTKVHGYAEKLVDGTEVAIPEELRGYAESAARWMDDFEIESVLVEVSFFNRTYKYAGTPDVIHWAMDKKRRGSDRFMVLSDYKTSASGIWPETALQLEANSRCEFYVENKDTELPVPKVEELWAIQLREDGYNRRRVIMPRDYLWRRFRAAQLTAEFTGRDRDEFYSSSPGDLV